MQYGMDRFSAQIISEIVNTKVSLNALYFLYKYMQFTPSPPSPTLHKASVH
jgi:hypothetical protein